MPFLVVPPSWFVESCERFSDMLLTCAIVSALIAGNGCCRLQSYRVDRQGLTYIAASSWRRLFARSTLGSRTVSGALATIAARCSDTDRDSSGTIGMMPSTLALLGMVRTVGTYGPSRAVSICLPASSNESISSPRRKRASNCNASASETVVRSLTSSS